MDSAVLPARMLCPVKGVSGVASLLAPTPRSGWQGTDLTSVHHRPQAFLCAPGCVSSWREFSPTRASTLDRQRWASKMTGKTLPEVEWDPPWWWALIVKKCTCGTLMGPAHSSLRERETSMGSARPSALSLVVPKAGCHHTEHLALRWWHSELVIIVRVYIWSVRPCLRYTSHVHCLSLNLHMFLLFLYRILLF